MTTKEDLREWVSGGDVAYLGVALVSSILLMCAVLASLGVGVLTAHVVCVGMFRVFRMHARHVAAARELKAPARGRLDVVGN